jgi:hypothetical protein
MLLRNIRYANPPNADLWMFADFPDTQPTLILVWNR